MAKRASQAGDARTTDRTSARRLGTELSTLRQAPSLDGRAEAPDRGRRHGAGCVGGDGGCASTASARGQFYAWRQQLLLRGALGAGTDTIPGLAGVDAATSAPHLEPAIPAPPGQVPHNGGRTGAARSAERPDRHDVPDGVAGRLDEDCGVEHAPTTDRKSVLNSPLRRTSGLRSGGPIR